MFQTPPRLDFGVYLDYLRIEKFKVDLMNLKISCQWLEFAASWRLPRQLP